MPMSFFAELKRRKVVRLAITYLLAGIVILGGADVLVPALALEEWVLRLVALLLILGFPLSLIMAWHFDWTPEGLKRADSADEVVPSAEPADSSGNAAAGAADATVTAKAAESPTADTPAPGSVPPASPSLGVCSQNATTTGDISTKWRKRGHEKQQGMFHANTSLLKCRERLLKEILE